MSLSTWLEVGSYNILFPEKIVPLISCWQIFSWWEFILSLRNAMFVMYPHGECRNAASQGAPQAKMYQLWMTCIIQAPANCLEAHSIFSFLPISSKKTAAYNSKHPFVESSFIISLVSTILPTKIKKSLWLRTLNSYAAKTCPLNQQLLLRIFSSREKQNRIPFLSPNQIPHRRCNFRVISFTEFLLFFCLVPVIESS